MYCRLTADSKQTAGTADDGLAQAVKPVAPSACSNLSARSSAFADVEVPSSEGQQWSVHLPPMRESG